MFQAHDTFSGPMIDGKLRPEDPQEVYVAGKQQRVPVILGATDLDAGFGKSVLHSYLR